MVSSRLAEFASGLQLDQIPAEPISRTTAMLLDSIGIMHFVSARTEWGRKIVGFAKSYGGDSRGAQVMGTDIRSSAPQAALANGTLAMGFEYEDMHIRASGHPFSIIAPAALAAAEVRNASGSELMAALMAGYEVGCRVSYGLPKGDVPWPERGIYPITMFGVFGAAAAAGRALQLSPGQLLNALGIAGSQAFGTMQAHKEGTMTRRLHAGRAAEIGVTSALLARDGFTGPSQALEGELGLYAAFAQDPARVDYTAILEGLGTEWATDGAWLKYFPCNGLFQAALEGLLQLIDENGVHESDVVRVSARIAKASRLHGRPSALTPVNAQFSLHYCLALALVQGRPRPSMFLEGHIGAEQVVAAMERIDVELDPALRVSVPDSPRPAAIEVTLSNGKRLSTLVTYPKGHPKNPMSWDDVVEKFEELVGDILTARRSIEVQDWVRGLAKSATIPSYAEPR